MLALLSKSERFSPNLALMINAIMKIFKSKLLVEN